MPDESSQPRSTRRPQMTLAVCVECGRPWQVEQEHWRAYWTDDEPPELAFYCSACDEAEFG